MTSAMSIETGYIPEDDKPEHLSYEDLLKPNLVPLTDGDVDLRPFTSPRHNQGNTGTCVANSTIKALEIKRIQKYGMAAHVDLSRLAVYYLARELMFPPQTDKDKGTHISLAFDVLRRFGVCPETDWPFDTAQVCIPPSWKAMRSAYLHKIGSFFRIRSQGQGRVQEVIRCLRAGHPVVYGTAVGDNWQNYQKGQVLNDPGANPGGHATVLIGYKDGVFIGENSWGNSWGDDGFYLLSPEVIASTKSSDFWTALAAWEVTP